MAKWDDIRSGVKSAASTTVKKTEEIASSASMHVKLARLMSKRDEQFEKLGKLTYRQLKTDDSYAEQISAVIAQIDALGAQIANQKAKIEQSKAEKANERVEKHEQKAAHAHATAEASAEQEKMYVDGIKEMLDANISD